jgi:eukaryotic-like serine/threonine-protein kinase
VAELKDRLQAALGDAYRIEGELGGGGMSRVFVAEEVALGRKVVVKVLPPEMGAGVNAERFRREIQLAASLQHPHIVPLLHAGQNADLVWYTMPLIGGESLRAKLAREGELPVSEAVRILRDVADALSHAHKAGVVHRDIKPDNVMISGRHAVVTDFGVAKAVSAASGGSNLTSLGVALGTPAYMAPEQAAADPHVDHRADLYALGALAYEMLSGRPPFIGTNPQQVLAAQVTQTPEPVTQHRAAVPPALAALVMRCLEKHPADRWQSAAEVHQQLEAAATPSGGMTPTGEGLAVSSGTEAAIRRGHPARVAAMFGGAAAAVLGVVYLLVRQLGLPDWVFGGAVILLAAGLPIMVTTGLIERRRAIARTSGRMASVPTGGLHGWLTWRRALTGGGVAFGVLGIGTAVYMAMRLLGIGPIGTLVASGVLETRDRLIVADFENRTADSALGASVTEAFRIDLAQSRVVRVMDRTAVAATLRLMNGNPASGLAFPLARDVAEREGLKAIVAGEIGPLGSGYVLTARLVSTADGSALVALRETAGDDSGIIGAVDRLSKSLRERIGESLKDIRANQPLERVTTASLEALRLYSRGQAAELVADWPRARQLYEDAVAIDTGFAMAYRKLAVVLNNSGGERERVEAAATQAFRHRERLPDAERHLAAAYYYSAVEQDDERASAAYRSTLDVDPQNRFAMNNLALILMERRSFAEAESLLLRAVSGNGSTVNYNNLIYTQGMQGEFAAAESSITQFAARFPGSPAPLGNRAQLAGAQRDWATAERASREQLTAAGTNRLQSRLAYLRLYRLAMLQGRLAEAERHLRASRELLDPGTSGMAVLTLSLNLAAWDLRFRNDPQGAVRRIEEAVRRSPFRTAPPASRPYGFLVGLYAMAGRPDIARRWRTEYFAEVEPRIRRNDPSHFFMDAVIAYSEKRPRDAIDSLRAGASAVNCNACTLYELAQAYDLAGEVDSTIAVFTRALTVPEFDRIQIDADWLAVAYRRLGELHAQRGERNQALDYYGRFVDLWKDADSDLQPQVRDVKQRMARLTGERP